MERGKKIIIKLKSNQIMIMWVFNIVYIYTEEVFEKYVSH